MKNIIVHKNKMINDRYWVSQWDNDNHGKWKIISYYDEV